MNGIRNLRRRWVCEELELRCLKLVIAAILWFGCCSSLIINLASTEIMGVPFDMAKFSRLWIRILVLEITLWLTSISRSFIWCIIPFNLRWKIPVATAYLILFNILLWLHLLFLLTEVRLAKGFRNHLLLSSLDVAILCCKCAKWFCWFVIFSSRYWLI